MAPCPTLGYATERHSTCQRLIELPIANPSMRTPTLLKNDNIILSPSHCEQQ